MSRRAWAGLCVTLLLPLTTLSFRPPVQVSMSSSAARDQERVVVVGGGIVGASIAYHLCLKGYKPTIIERSKVASAASGKSGGFLARSWGDGGVTEQLHHVSFDMHAELAETLGVTSYRRIPTLSVRGGVRSSSGTRPSWLDGKVQAKLMDEGTAQVTPLELTTKLMDFALSKGAHLEIGAVEGVEISDDVVKAVKLEGGRSIPADKCVIAMGPWTTVAGDWFGVPFPMQGIKSTSIVFPGTQDLVSEPFALFCEEDRNGCHLEVYPRPPGVGTPNGEVYICGIGGSDYVDKARLSPGGDCDRPEKIGPDSKRVAAAQASFQSMSSTIGSGEVTSNACMRPCPPDALPILGPIPTVENAFVAAGHNCWGILWAPVTGLIVSELVADGRSKTVDISAFSPDRFMPRGSKRGRKMRDSSVGEQW